MTAVSGPSPHGTLPPPSPPPVAPTSPPPSPLGASLRRVAVVLVVTAVLADLAVQARGSGLAATLSVWTLCAGLAFAGRVRRRGGRLVLGVAAGVAVFLALRASPWLIIVDLAAIGALLALACSAERDRRPLDTRFGGVLRRLWSAFTAVVVAPPRAIGALASLLPRRDDATRDRTMAVLRGLVLAAPVVVVIGLFLAWADPVFAAMFDLRVDLAPMWGHLALVAVGIWWAAGFFVQASRPPLDPRSPSVSVGPVEGLVVMGGLTALYATFAWSQLMVARRGADYVMATTGTTYAEYARSGFFQLLWVAAVTVLVLISLRSVVRLPTAATRRLFAVLGVAAAGLTLVIVHAALLRLQLYDDVFGLTLLRFYSSAAAWWLGAVFVLVGAATAVGTRSRDWLPSAVLGSALVALVVVNVLVPDRLVVEHNLDRTAEGEEFDVSYARSLSSDATPALVDALDRLEGFPRDVLLAELCGPDDATGPAGWNLSLRQAAAAIGSVCD